MVTDLMLGLGRMGVVVVIWRLWYLLEVKVEVELVGANW